MTSELYPGESPIHDSTPFDVLLHPDGDDVGRGLDLSLRGPGEYAYGGVAEPFPAELLIDPSEWQARIQEMEETKTRVSDRIRAAKLPPKNQEQTSYCWINAPTAAVEVVRLFQNQEYVELSPASAGARIKNFQNVGGWGKEGLGFIIDNGLVPVDRWPANAISRQYYTAANIELAKQYRVTEWWELRPRNVNEMVSALLRRMVAPIGLSFWGHEVYAVDPVWLDGTIAVRFRNSWGPGYGDFGFNVLQGSRMLPDDIVVPRVATAS